VVRGVHALPLRTAGGNGPQAGLRVDFRPSGAEHSAGTGRGQDGKYQGASGGAFALATIGRECGKLGIGQQRMNKRVYAGYRAT
jgi:hypothetical protein